MTAKAAAVLTAVLPSALVMAANMEPVKFEAIASADWGVVAIAPSDHLQYFRERTTGL